MNTADTTEANAAANASTGRKRSDSDAGISSPDALCAQIGGRAAAKKISKTTKKSSVSDGHRQIEEPFFPESQNQGGGEFPKASESVMKEREERRKLKSSDASSLIPQDATAAVQPFDAVESPISTDKAGHNMDDSFDKAMYAQPDEAPEEIAKVTITRKKKNSKEVAERGEVDLKLKGGGHMFAHSSSGSLVFNMNVPKDGTYRKTIALHPYKDRTVCIFGEDVTFQRNLRRAFYLGFASHDDMTSFFNYFMTHTVIKGEGKANTSSEGLEEDLDASIGSIDSLPNTQQLEPMTPFD